MRSLTGIHRSIPTLVAGLFVFAIAATVVALMSIGSSTEAGEQENPIPISTGNPSCSVFDDEFGGGSTWTEFKLEDSDLSDGTPSDGTLFVTISNFVPSSNPTPGSFDWSSNIGVDAVFVKAGNDKHNLYLYIPEATSDSGLGPQAGSGNGISHISFCYDIEDETRTPTPTPPPTPTPTPTALIATATPEPTVTPTVLPAVLSPTGGTPGSGSSGLGLLLVLGGIVVLAGVALVTYSGRRSLDREL